MARPLRSHVLMVKVQGHTWAAKRGVLRDASRIPATLASGRVGQPVWYLINCKWMGSNLRRIRLVTWDFCSASLLILPVSTAMKTLPSILMSLQGMKAPAETLPNVSCGPWPIPKSLNDHQRNSFQVCTFEVYFGGLSIEWLSDLWTNVSRSRSLSLFCLTGRTPASQEFVLLVLLVGCLPQGQLAEAWGWACCGARNSLKTQFQNANAFHGLTVRTYNSLSSSVASRELLCVWRRQVFEQPNVITNITMVEETTTMIFWLLPALRHWPSPSCRTGIIHWKYWSILCCLYIQPHLLSPISA